MDSILFRLKPVNIWGLEFAEVIEALEEDHHTSFKIGDEVCGLSYNGK
jgi:hypothetical protein